jgi:hypothetical protein|tara:strand:- start:643 stop:846 length:204 start_codon:yes stop_codon:yes gene_type:complete
MIREESAHTTKDFRVNYDADEIREMIVKFGRLRQLQGQAEGPGDWHREPHDLRVEADKILDEIEEAL